MGDMITAGALFAAGLFLLVVSSRSFQEKGFLLNNAYIFASRKERETMNKKPYYRQTAIVFLMMGILFFLLGFAVLLDAAWITSAAGLLILILLVYAIASSIAIERRKMQK